MTDFSSHSDTLISPGRELAAVTPNDDADLPRAREVKALYVGVAGDLVVVPISGGEPITIKNAYSGYHPIRVRRVLATGTTATDILALL